MSNLASVLQRALFLVLPSLAALCAAQVPVEPALVPPDNSYRFAAKRLEAAPEDLFTRIITGRFNDDAQPDVFLRRRSSAQLFVNPTSWDAALAVPGIVRGVARLGGSAATGRDEILVATPNGLRAWTRDSTAGVFGSRAIGNDVLWGHVEHLVAADLDSQFGDDIVGIAPGGGQALVLLAQAGGTFAPELVFPLPWSPLCVLACDFGGVGSKQLVFIGQAAVRVYGYDGSPRLALPVPGSAVATVLRKGTGLRERVAWITQSGEGDVLRLLDMQLAPPVPLGNLDSAGIARWDFDHDGDDDLAVSHRSGWNLRLLTNVSGAFNVVAQQKLVTGPPGPAASNSAWPAVTDLDGDGDEDVLIPVQADEMISVHLGGAIEHRDDVPGFGHPVLFNHGSFGEGEPRGHLQITAVEEPAPPQGATHLELVVWRKLDLETPTNPRPEPGLTFRWDALTEETCHHTGIIDYDDPDPSVLFWIQRYVELDASGEVVRVFPSAIHALTVEDFDDDNPGPVTQYLLDNGGVFESSTSPDMGFQNFTNSRTTSTIIRLVPIVGFEEDLEPEDDS